MFGDVFGSSRFGRVGDFEVEFVPVGGACVVCGDPLGACVGSESKGVVLSGFDEGDLVVLVEEDVFVDRHVVGDVFVSVLLHRAGVFVSRVEAERLGLL
jgi:hypothetical protein